MDERRTITRIGLICALIFTACFLAAWPIAEMGFNDDWSYIKSAQVFAQTGHLVYSGWAMAMLGWQVLWGALFVRLFGLSFTAVKLSTFPLAIGILLLFHAVQVRFGISSRNAIVGTLTLGLSPLFMPLAASFIRMFPDYSSLCSVSIVASAPSRQALTGRPLPGSASPRLPMWLGEQPARLPGLERSS